MLDALEQALWYRYEIAACRSYSASNNYRKSSDQS